MLVSAGCADGGNPLAHLGQPHPSDGAQGRVSATTVRITSDNCDLGTFSRRPSERPSTGLRYTSVRSAVFKGGHWAALGICRHHCAVERIVR